MVLRFFMARRTSRLWVMFFGVRRLVALGLSLFEPILESQPRHFLEIPPIGREQ
jgi:hypothetical protein